MILVDASVIVDYLKSASEQTRKKLIEHDAAICGLTRAELLCGARTLADINKINVALDGFHAIEIPEVIWPLLGENLFRLRSRGIVVPFQDALLATIAIHYGMEVWTADAHFPMIQSVLPELRLFAG